MLDVVSTRDILTMAAVEGARAAHLEARIGSPREGKPTSSASIPGAERGPLNHASGAIVMLMDTSNVESVIIGGRLVKHAGSLVEADVAPVVGALQGSAEGIIARSGYPGMLFASCRS